MTISATSNVGTSEWYRASKTNNSAAVQGLEKAAADKVNNSNNAAKTAEAPSAVAATNSQSLVSTEVSRRLLKEQEAASVGRNDVIEGASDTASTHSDAARFADIITKALEGGAYDDPEGYVKSLSQDDLQVLRRVHGIEGNGNILDQIEKGSAASLFMPPGSGSSVSPSNASESNVAEPVVKYINGKKVIVSGHSVDNSENASFFHTAGEENHVKFSPEFLAQLAREQQGLGSDMSKVTGSMEVTSNNPFKEQPLGMEVHAYEAINSAWPSGDRERAAYRPIHDTDAEKIDHYRTNVKEYMDVLSMEEQLQQEYGEDVKLVYSFVDDSYIMLTPDDALYNDLAPASEGMRGIMENIGNGHISANNVADIFEAYGHGDLLQPYGYKA